MVEHFKSWYQKQDMTLFLDMVARARKPVSVGTGAFLRFDWTYIHCVLGFVSKIAKIVLFRYGFFNTVQVSSSNIFFTCIDLRNFIESDLSKDIEGCGET